MTPPTSPLVTVETLKRLGWNEVSRNQWYSRCNGARSRLRARTWGGGIEYLSYQDELIPTPATEADLLELCRLLGIPTE